MKGPENIIIVDRFAPLRAQLLAVLAELGEDDWARPTAAPRWSVKDAAAHLLGGDIWILSGKRDGFRSNPEINSHTQLIELVDRLNAEWVLAMRRMSPRALREPLAFWGPQVESYFSSLDPMKIGDAVSWRVRNQRPSGSILPASLQSAGTTNNRFAMRRDGRLSTTCTSWRLCWIHSCELCLMPSAKRVRRGEL